MVEEGRWRRSRKRGRRWVEKEITRRWTTRFAWELVSVLAKSYYALSFSSFAPFILSFSPPALSSPLFHSPSLFLSFVSSRLVSSLSLSLSLSHIYVLSFSRLWPSSSLPISFPQRRVDACVRTQARKVLLSPTPMQAQRRASDLVSLSPFLTLLLSFALLSSRSRYSPPL